MSARTILKHLHQQGRMTDYQFDVINRNLKARPTGEWIREDKVHSKCSLCGFKYADYGILFNFCPDCGADMRVKDELNRVKDELEE